MNSLRGSYSYLLYPICLACAGAGAMLFFSHASWAGILLSLALVAAGLLAGRQLAAVQAQSRKSIEIYLAGWQQFGGQLVPVWSGHIETSRSQMETAISSLAARFSGIVDKLDHAVTASSAATQSVEGSGSGLVAVFAASEKELGSVVA